MQYEEWKHALRICCGHFCSEPKRDRAPSEPFEVVKTFGLDAASIHCHIDRIDRDRRALRRDDAEHFFLIYPVGGYTGYRHCGRDEKLEQHEFILLDSIQPLQTVFGSQDAEFLSVHIPRELFLSPINAGACCWIKAGEQKPPICEPEKSCASWLP